MADISTYLAAIMSAVYGEDVRGSIHDAIELINDVSEKSIDTGTAVTSASSSSAGYYKNSLYINLNTYDLWRCTGTNSWVREGNIKGAAGKGITSIVKTSTSGLVDTYTITYDDGTTTTFSVTNGKDGVNGTNGTNGISVTGVTLVSKVGLVATYRMSFSDGSHFDYTVSDGAAGTGTGDMTKAVYDTDGDGIVDAAKTIYGLTATIADLNKTANLATVATSGSYTDLSNKPTIPTITDTYSATSSNGMSGKAVASAISEKVDTSLLKSTVGWTGKNRLKITSSVVSSDIYMVNRNSDGEVTSIVANGTPSAQSNFQLVTNFTLDKPMILSGCPSGGSVNDYFIYAKNSNNDYYYDYGNGVTLPSGSYSTMQITTRADVSMSNKEFRPMLRDASITDDTYEPYHESVEEEIEQIYADNRVLGAKNLLPYPYTHTTKTSTGITFTDNGDGTITANGTATADANFTIANAISVNEPMILSGCPENGSDSTYRLIAQVGSSYLKDYGEGLLIDSNITQIYIQIKNGQTVNNLVFKPMLRLASDPDDTYVPYAMTNRELTEEIATIPTVNNGQLTIQHNGTNKATFTANQSGNATANIITDTWTSTATVSSNGTVSFSGLNDSYGYKIYYTLPSGDSAYTFSKVTKSGSGTSVTLTYTTDAPSGTVCKLRILK